MKILHLITSLNTGGAERMLVKLLTRLQGSTFSAEVISLCEFGPQTEPLREIGIPVHSLNLRRGRPTPAAWFKLRKLIQEKQPDLIMAWMYHAGVAALLTNQGIPTTLNIQQSLQDIRLEKRTVRWTIRALGRLSSRARGIVYCSRIARQQHEAFGYASKHPQFIPNGIDTSLFQPDPEARLNQRHEWGCDDDTIVIGHLGRSHPMKGHPTLLEAAGLLLSQHPSVRFVLGGPEMDQNNRPLVELIEQLNLGDKITLLGERRDVPQVLNGFDIFTLSSGWAEGFPNVLGEAMACGVPCVTTEVGDSGLIVGETGFSVPPSNPSAIATAWEKILALTPEKRRDLGGLARQRIADEFSLETATSLYQRFFTEVGPQLK